MPDLTPRGGDTSDRDVADLVAIVLTSVDKDTLQDAIDVATEAMLNESNDVKVRAVAGVIRMALRSVELGASFDYVRAQLEPFLHPQETDPP